MDFSKSVIMPREDFEELQIAAWDHNPPTVGERVGQTIQTSMVFAGLTAAFSVGTWAWYKLMSKLEAEKHAHKVDEINLEAQKLPNK